MATRLPDCRPLLTEPSSGYTAFHSTCVIQRYSNGKTCLPKRKMVSALTSCDVDHVLKWTRLSVSISAVGSKVMRKYYIAGGGLGTRLQVGHDQAKTLTGDVTGIRAHHNKSRDSRSRQLLRFRNRTRPAEKADLHTETMMAAVLAMSKERSTITITILSS